MRMGKTPRTRGWSTAGEKSQHIAGTGTRIGQVSADLMATYFQPKIIHDIASETLERYATEWLSYQDVLSNTTMLEMDIGPNGSIESTDGADLPLPPRKPLFHSPTQKEDVNEMMTDISEHFFSRKNAGWRIHVNAAKFERQLDEKYGMFRPFLQDHPMVERSLRNLQRQYNSITVFRTGPPPIPRGTAVILLFLLQRGKVRWDVLLLAALFLLVGLQPWALVLLVCIVQGGLQRRKYTPVGSMQRQVPPLRPYWETNDDDDGDADAAEQNKKDILLRPVGQPLVDPSSPSSSSTTAAATTTVDTSQYDALLIGTGPSTLYAGALLSRAGRKVLVLSSADDASGCVTLDPSLLNTDNNHDWAHVPFDIDNCTISKLVSGQQVLLAPVLATTQDRQGGLRFAQIGSTADGYTSRILSVPGMGGGDGKHSVPFLVQTGMTAFMEGAAEYLGDTLPPVISGETGEVMVGDSLTGQYLQSCRKLNEGAGYFFLSKILPESVTKLSSSSSSSDSSSDSSGYKNAAIRPSSTLLNACFPLHPQLRALMAAVGMSGENRPPSTTSLGAHLSNVCSSITDGMHYPVGGPRALCHALASTITQGGGRVVTQTNVRELLFDASIQNVPQNNGHTASTTNDADTPPVCVGVALSDGTKIRFAAERYSNTDRPLPVVVSLEGFIPTFIRYLPDDIRTQHKVPRGLPALSERRPLVHFLFGLRGSAAELNVTGADYFRLPNAAVPQDQVDPATGAVTFGEIGWSAKVVNDEAAAAEEEDGNEDLATTTPADDGVRRKKGRGVQFELGSSWMRITFPSAKDPSFRERHGDITTCVVTIEADDDLVTEFETKPRIFAVKRSTAVRSHLTRMASTIRQELLDTYPQLEGHIVHQQLRGPYVAGLSNNPERYAAMGIRAASPYPCLYAGGSDLTVGNTFSGGTVGAWLVANAVCGYNAIDHLVLQKNITSDLERFLPPSYDADDDGDDEHLAVPFAPMEEQDLAD